MSMEKRREKEIDGLFFAATTFLPHTYLVNGQGEKTEIELNQLVTAATVFAQI